MFQFYIKTWTRLKGEGQDLLDDKEKLFNEFFEFIGVEPFPLKSPIRKNTSENMREILLNYDEIKNYYSDTPYAKMFD